MKSSFSRKSVQRRRAPCRVPSPARPLRPPFLGVKSVAGEEHGERGPAAPLAGVRRGRGSSPQTGSDSIHGSAIVTPRPRRNVRRERLVSSA